MKNIFDVDKNFKVKTNIKKEGVHFYRCLEPPFGVFDVFYEGGRFRRMPEVVAASVSDGVRYLHTNTAGGRVRFKTDSAYLAISAILDNVGKMSHLAFTGAIGFVCQ